ncbi:MAG: hypothetical protein A2169_10120 [Deltaproteobacteria bacterium RBG_13_47_9]|nr:MAG: hypothetical protein A2169_10120 [Deltaproteobacteria bacterium RBG_13_47_9]
MYAKVSKKGQVTIPKKIRKILNVDAEGVIVFLLEKNEIKLKGIPAAKTKDLAGSLKKYAGSYTPLKKARSVIQRKVANDAATEGLSD